MTICVVPSAPLSICYRSVASLVPDRRNARTHPKRQVEQIAASIREFGFANPILADAEGTIIAGHGRLLAAKALGMTEVPTIVLRHLSEAQKRALRIADNRIALGAGWDLDLLKLELGELAVLDVDLDLALTGFSSGEIDVILKGPADPEDEVIPAVPATPRTRPGDIWILGEHRVGCGDGRDLAFLQAVVGDGAVVDAAFLDPPYNVRINGHANAKGRHREFAMASGEMNAAAFRTLPLRHARRLRPGFPRWRGALRLHGLAAPGGCRRSGSIDLRRAAEPLRLEQVERRDGFALSLEARARLRLPGRQARRTSTPSSLAGTAATAPTSGTMPRSTRWPAAGARTWRCTRR